MKIYTMGYTGWTLKQIERAVMQCDAVLVDVRIRPYSRQVIYNQKNLVGLLGERYAHIPGFGNRNYKGGPIVLADFTGGAAKAAELMSETGKTLLLMCVCQGWRICHRSLVAEKLKELWSECDVEIIHLNKPEDAEPGLFGPGGVKG